MNKKRTIHLPPANGITGQSSNPYKEYATLRKYSPDFNSWVRRTYGKQGALCFYCQCDLSKRRINVEHVKPLSRGGQSSSSNMVISCPDCNKSKGSELLSDKTVSTLRSNAKSLARVRAKKYRADIEYQHKLAQDLSWIT